jgi:hypothetical protein
MKLKNIEMKLNAKIIKEKDIKITNLALINKDKINKTIVVKTYLKNNKVLKKESKNKVKS